MITQVKVISDDGTKRFIMHNERSKKHPQTYQVESLTVDELVNHRPTHVYFITRFNTLAQAKVTSVKTWKTRPGDIDIGLKYGLYEYFYATYRNGIPVNEQLVKVVED